MSRGTASTRGGRALLAERLPAALMPVLVMLDELPVKTSGKTDRKALPWPPPVQSTDGELDETGEFIAARFRELLGGTDIGPGSDFFALGGSSLNAAQLVSALRTRFPRVTVKDVYSHPVLDDLASFLADGREGTEERRPPARPVSKASGAAFTAVLAVLLIVTGLRWTLSLATAANFIGLVVPNWPVPQTSWYLIIVGWLVLFSPPGRILTAVACARVLTARIAPGVYPRGGAVHLRLWAAERVAGLCGVGALAGTPWARLYARMLGCEVGCDVELHTMPPTTGMGVFGTGCAVEPEADVAGWWLNGDELSIGEVRVGPNARVGARSTLLPGAVVCAGAEVLPGTEVSGTVPVGVRWAGSPGRAVPDDPGLSWPAPRTPESPRWGWGWAYSVALVGLGVLPLLAGLPILVVTMVLMFHGPTAGLLGSILIAVAGVVVRPAAQAMLTATAVRIASRSIRPGLHRTDGGVAFAAWLVHRLSDSGRRGLFPLYASLATPTWMRMLGSEVGRRSEVSTLHSLPSLTKIGDYSFLADDTLTAPYEMRGGWMRLGYAEVGSRAFLGNSGIVGPGRAVPDEGLIGVLSQAPATASRGSSWFGQPPMQMPRKVKICDAARTYDPPRRLVLARGAVEICRVLPLIISALLGALAVAVLYQLDENFGLLVEALLSGVVLCVLGVVACLVATLFKWVLIGRAQPAEHPLWSSWVWRNELVDVAVEELAVPWLAGAATGTPLIAAWFRTLGAKIGKGVWIETWWLPEPDMIELGDGATLNRGVIVQTHLFHDRIMQLDRVTLAPGATLGPHSVALPGSLVGQDSAVGPVSLVMRGESVPAATSWTGNPLAPTAFPEL